jgi:hypothetical protein
MMKSGSFRRDIFGAGAISAKSLAARARALHGLHRYGHHSERNRAGACIVLAAPARPVRAAAADLPPRKRLSNFWNLELLSTT